MEIPKQLEQVDLTELRALCQEYIEYLAEDEFSEDNDYDGYIFEKALEAIFGNRIWDYVNDKIQKL